MLIEENTSSFSGITLLAEPAPELCTCAALAVSHLEREEHAGTGNEPCPVTPATPELAAYLRQKLDAHFPGSEPFSILLLHISQVEQLRLSSKSPTMQDRLRYHAPVGLLEQVFANVRRTIRLGDAAIAHGGTGAAIIFPGVDQEGAFGILERVYHSIDLLQPETVIPPLVRETDIFIGMGSYPSPASSPEELLRQASNVAHRLTLRPAVFSHLGARNAGLNGANGQASHHAHSASTTDAELAEAQSNGIPFMQLPARLPARLKHLLPYHLARELRCAPVGRDHNRLTVAMAIPNNSHAVRLLAAATSMAIFPVSCETAALDTLLASEW